MNIKEAINLINLTIPQGNNAMDIQLREALNLAISCLKIVDQCRWERDIATEQLHELGLGLGQKVDHVKELIERDKLKPTTVYDNCGNKGRTLRCPKCFETIGSSYWKFCPECGQRIDV